MERQLVIQIESPQQLVGAWPRLLRIIAIATLVFCLVQLMGTAQSFYYMFKQRPALVSRQGRIWPDYIGIRTLLLIAAAIVDVVMAGAAASLWKRGRGVGVLIVCLWLLLGILAVEIAQYLFFINWSSQFLA